MPIKSIVRLMPHAVMRPGRRPRRLSLAASLAAAATLTACLAAGSVATAPGRPARPGTGSSASTGAVSRPLLCGPPDYFIQCYSPGQYQVAYGVAPLLKRGITGNGETVVMPELANKPGPNFTDIRKDLAAFDRKFGLPTAKLKVTTTLAGASAPYVAGTEEVEDTEIVHAIAPGATLDVVLVPANATTSAANFTAAVTGTIHAAITQHAAVVSISGSHGEHFFTPAQVASLHAALQQAADPPPHGRRLLRGHRRDQRHRPAGAGQPARLRPAGTGRGRHRPRRQPHHRRLPRRDGLERRHQCLRRRLQCPVPQAVLPGRRRRAPAACAASPTSPPTPTPPPPWR